MGTTAESRMSPQLVAVTKMAITSQMGYGIPAGTFASPVSAAVGYDGHTGLTTGHTGQYYSSGVTATTVVTVAAQGDHYVS